MEYEQIQNRRKSILSLLKTKSILTVEDVCSQLKITDSTARRDIKWLEERHLIRRFHGGISAIKDQYDVFDIRNKTNLEWKKKIGETAARMVCSSDIVFIGGGSTMFQFSLALLQRSDLKDVLIVTAAFNVAALFAEKSRFDTIILGGNLKKIDETIASKMTIENAKTLNYTKMFNGAMGVSAEAGITQPTADLAELERTVASRSAQNYILADHTKFSTVGPYTTYAIDQVNMVITDRHRDVDGVLKQYEKYREKIEQVG